MNRLTQALRRAIDARLQPAYLRLVSIAVLAVGGVLLCMSFATSDRGQTKFGTPLGNDFAGFYVAAQILDRGYESKLYDRDLHDQLYHALLPNLDKNDSIPYVHPPFVAGVLRPLTHLPYEAAVAVWFAISVSLYGAGCWFLIRSLRGLPRDQTTLILLMALSFEPFLMECWLGGQLSAVGFFSYAVAWLLFSRNRPIAAGMALGLSFYKPTLLLLMLPLLVVGRCGRILLGMTITGVFLAGLSLTFVGWDVSVGYLDVLLSFRKNTAGGDLQIVAWKYVDLNNSLLLLCGGKSPFQTAAFVGLFLVPFAFLVRCWWQWPSRDATQHQWLWAATLAWLPVLNLYVGIYDSIFVVQSAVIAADVLLRERRSEAPLTDSGFAYCTLAIAGSAWFSQSLARASGFQCYTIALISLGVLELRLYLTRS
ncbi:MAG: glycosyltransferase family 87 protein [Planctomycetia bacterium]|nr:glycosyltransferase family 87 protein [Planctomycetia bacterium]